MTSPIAPLDTALLLPMTAHVALAALLYVLLTIARAPAIWGIGRRADGSNPWATVEPRISANLSNQFEWPLFFHVACMLLMVLGTGTTAMVLAWVFVGGRVLHSGIQVFTTNVRLRGLVFTVNFLAVLGLWSLLLQVALEHASW
ncbi:MAPEG family protein [Pseudoxanthomonas sp. LjRoot143]|uniref:MAPEG family protein n=1 Tax=unclassified Pseudoxanthomonas TaxID=2645906 RepID=UPI0017866DE0|nr:MAPEG family protein [Pseudoxanthomonas sp. PXM01]MBD9470096.1 MAPEG family protein [Pseudoxanthomonas sp. PXM01]